MVYATKVGNVDFVCRCQEWGATNYDWTMAMVMWTSYVLSGVGSSQLRQCNGLSHPFGHDDIMYLCQG